MQNSITSQSEIADPVELEAILREYLGQEVRNMRTASGIDVALDGLVSATMENIDAYLPPDGRLLLARSGESDLLGTIFLKRIRDDAAEIKRLYVRPSARGIGLGRQLPKR